MAYSIFPFVVWAALRFGQQGTTIVTLVASGLAIWGTVGGLGPFGTGPVPERLLLLQIFMAVIAITGMLLAAALSERRQAAEDLSRQREWLQVTLASIGDGVIVTDTQGTVTFLNTVAQALTGWRTEALGKGVSEVFHIVHEKTRQPLEDRLAKALREESVVGLAEHTLLIANDGREIPVDDSSAPIRAANGQIVGMVLVFRDDSQRRRHERRAAVLHGLARTLAEGATLAEATPRILQTIGDSLGWQLGAIWEVDDDARVLRCAEVWHDGPERFRQFRKLCRERTFERGIGLPGRVWASGQPAWIPNVLYDSNFPRAPIAAQEGLHGAFGFPIRLGNEVLGVIEFFSPAIRNLMKTCSA